MKCLYLIFILLFPITDKLLSQSKRDYCWVMGYDTTSLTTPGGNAFVLDFNKTPMESYAIHTLQEFEMAGSNTSICDTTGKILFYSNGCYIVNATHEIMENGDAINPGLIQDGYCHSGGDPIDEGVLAIPWPDHDSLYLVFNIDFRVVYFPGEPTSVASPLHLYYHVIDISQNNGLGKVTEKLKVAVSDTLAGSQLRGTPHANGRDWWIITPASRSNCYYLTLVTPEGVQPSMLKCNGAPWNDFDRSGQSVFSPDGTKYVRYNKDNGIHIFDFDHATGDLSNQIIVDISSENLGYGGVSISPNSRYLYLSGTIKMFQFDLQAPDIGASKVLLGIYENVPDPFWPAAIFNRSALAPDGKIYIAGGGTHESLHIVHKPNCAGLSCQFEQRGLKLLSWSYNTIPNFPNYPHNDLDTKCDGVSTLTPQLPTESWVYPNPSTGDMTIRMNQPMEDVEISLVDLNGKTRFRQHYQEGPYPLKIAAAHLPPGIYFLLAKQSGITIVREKVILQ